MLRQAAIFSVASAAGVAQVADYIADANCKAQYIRFSAPACVTASPAACYPHGSATAGCTDVEQWQWPGHAAGVNPHPSKRVTANGEDAQKTVWAYAGAVTQGEAMQIYSRVGADGKRTASDVTAEGVLNTPVNMVSFIANVLIDKPAEWFRPGHNNTNGCGQNQTWELPFGFNGNATTSLPKFQKNLKLMHENGKTIAMTLGSWCTSFPVQPEEEWSAEDFGAFVSYFQKIRQDVFGGYLDGVDFDWEGYCSAECLKGANACHCAWDDHICGDKTPEELAAGVRWQDASGAQQECWRMATKSTVQVMTGISYHMKQAGFVVTLVPMSTQVYSGDEDSSGNQVMRNEFVKYRMQPYPGGKAISGDVQANLLDLADGILLQWYSGFDAALCLHSSDPHACSCDNMPDADYPNVLNMSKDGMLVSYWSQKSSDGNFFPTTFPIRCVPCSGTTGPNACATPEETWFTTCRGNDTACAAEHKAGLSKYSASHKGQQNWWPKGKSVPSACPRSVDCPDWRYEGEEAYSRQLKLLQSLSKVLDVSKVSIGFEALGIDVQVQMHAWQDPALPWTDVSPAQVQQEHIYYKDCVQNLSTTNADQEMRCAQPLLTQQWGPKFTARDVVGLDAAVQKALGKSLSGVGFFTLDGVIAVPQGEKPRYWRQPLLDLNATWAHVPAPAQPTPIPGPPQPTPIYAGKCTHASPKNPCGGCNEPQDCGGSDWSVCWKVADPSCPAGPSPAPAPPTPPTPTPGAKAGFCVHTAAQNACGACNVDSDCGGAACWAAKDYYCPAEATALFAVEKKASRGTCVKNATKNACGACDAPEDCGGKDWTVCWASPDPQCSAEPAKGAQGFCTKAAPKNACKSCNAPEDCGGSDWTVCWKVQDPQCTAAPAKTTSWYCKAAAAQNACAACATDADCGDEHAACWAVKDYSCPKDGLLLKLKQEIVV